MLRTVVEFIIFRRDEAKISLLEAGEKVKKLEEEMESKQAQIDVGVAQIEELEKRNRDDCTQIVCCCLGAKKIWFSVMFFLYFLCNVVLLYCFSISPMTFDVALRFPLIRVKHKNILCARFMRGHLWW